MTHDPVFFSEKVDRAIQGKDPGEQLDILGKMITDAEFDKMQGYGPPAHDLSMARRKWIAIYDAHFAPIEINPENGTYADKVAHQRDLVRKARGE